MGSRDNGSSRSLAIVRTFESVRQRLQRRDPTFVGFIPEHGRVSQNGTGRLVHSEGRFFALAAAVVAGYVVVEDALEVRDDGVAFESDGKLAVDIGGWLRFFKCSGQRDADVGVLALAGAVDDAAHDG